MANKNIIYISYDGLTDTLGQSQILPYVIGLSKLGYTFDIVACEKPHNYSVNKNIIEQICAENNISWHPVVYHANPKVLSTIYDLLLVNKKVKQLCRNKKVSLLHCRSYLASLIGLAFKRKYHIPFLFDMRGFWADERVDGNLWNRENILFNAIYKYFKKREIEFIGESDAIISLTEAGKSEMLQWNLPIAAHKIEVIPCCADEAHFDPSRIHATDIANLRAQLNIQPDALVFLYLGSVGTWYLTTEMMELFKYLKSELPQSILLIATPDSEAKVLQEAAKVGLDASAIIIKKVPRKEVPIHIAASDYGLFFIKPAYSKLSSSPTKQAEILFMNKPLICNNNVGDTGQLVAHNKWGIVINKFDKQEYAKVLIEIMADSLLRTDIRKEALNYFSLSKGVNKYLKIYQTCINESN